MIWHYRALKTKPKCLYYIWLLKGATRGPWLPREMGHSGEIQDNANSVVLDPDQEGGGKNL